MVKSNFKDIDFTHPWRSDRAIGDRIVVGDLMVSQPGAGAHRNLRDT